MADTTAEHLTSAIAAHGQWKARLRTAIDKGSSDLDPAAASKDDRCDLGKWLYGGATPEERKSPHYASCLAAHKEFHKVAGDVLGLAVAGKQAEANAALAVGGSFAAASARITSELMRWQREVA